MNEICSSNIVDLCIMQGSEYVHTFQYREADETTVIPLTGYTARCQIRAGIDDTDTIFDGTSGTGELSINGALGEVTLTVSGAASSLWDDYEGVFDVEVIDGVGIPTRIAQGSMFLDREVTR